MPAGVTLPHDVEHDEVKRAYEFQQSAILHSMRKEDLIAFATRDWKAIAALKRSRWATLKSRMTPAEALEVGDQLREHMKALQPDWPTKEQRQEDMAVHIRVSESLRRVKPPEGR